MTLRPFTVILPAAGSGTRFGGDKLLADLCGKCVLARTVGLFVHRPDTAAIVIATAPDRFATYRDAIDPSRLPLPIHFTPGGIERWDTVYNALCTPLISTEFVAIHDAARPLTPTDVIDAAFAAAMRHGAALPTMPEPATLKAVASTNTGVWVNRTVDRRGIHQAQTPQCFRTALLRDAFKLLIDRQMTAGLTDDAQVAELAGHSPCAAAGSSLNIKITHAEDMRLAEAIYRIQHPTAAVK